jgi:hypothetical protein
MSQFARVESLDALRECKAALAKFRQTVQAALLDADADMQQTIRWVQNEQRSYWQGQIQKRSDAVHAAREAVRQKQLFTSGRSAGDSAAEEKKALMIAQRRLEEAEQKFAATRAWGQRLPQEAILYRGLANRLANQAETRLPQAQARLGQIIANLEAYLALQAPETARPGAATGGPGAAPAPTMSRGGEAPAAPATAAGPTAPPTPSDAPAPPAGAAPPPESRP